MITIAIVIDSTPEGTAIKYDTLVQPDSLVQEMIAANYMLERVSKMVTRIQSTNNELTLRRAFGEIGRME